MAVRGINMMEEFRWSSSRDDGTDATSENPNPDNPKTYFWFGPIDATVRAKIVDSEVMWSQDDAGRPAYSTRIGTRNIDLVRFMIKKAENYSDPDGKPIVVDFEDRAVNGKVYKVATEIFLSTIPPDIMNEMGNMLAARITQNQAQAKN